MPLEELPLDRVRPATDQPRKTFYQESLEELAESIKQRGVLEPIVVRPLTGADAGVYEIIMGERRYRASRLAGRETIPAIVKELSDEDAAAEALLENFQREDLNPVEKARAVQGLLQFMTYEKVARTLGVSETTIRRILELMELPPHVQQELVARPGAGQNPFSEGHARALITLNNDPSTQMRLVNKVKTEKVNVGDLEQLIAAIDKFPLKKEIFLHVPFSVSEQLVRSMGAKEARKKPYRAQTAHEHLKAIDRQSSTLIDLLDERIVEYLSTEEMNQLLASINQGTRQMDTFTTKIREALENQDYGFSETYLHCPLCGRIELVGSMRCATCWTILRRCYDCGNYDRGFERCNLTGNGILLEEAETPKPSSASYKCADYKPKFTPQGVKLKMAA